MITNIKVGKDIVEKEINKGSTKKLVVTDGFKKAGGFVYSYDFEKSTKNPLEAIDDPFIFLSSAGKIAHYDPYANPEEYKNGQKHLVRFK